MCKGITWGHHLLGFLRLPPAPSAQRACHQLPVKTPPAQISVRLSTNVCQGPWQTKSEPRSCHGLRLTNKHIPLKSTGATGKHTQQMGCLFLAQQIVVFLVVSLENRRKGGSKCTQTPSPRELVCDSPSWSCANPGMSNSFLGRLEGSLF